ncbi:MAG: hypothetical protein KGJ13_08585 [Patescibacteria group bacterium]|nr:hypothetical protein [Patescibacteria group bacterium]
MDKKIVAKAKEIGRITHELLAEYEQQACASPGCLSQKSEAVANSLVNPFYCDSRPKSETEPRYWGMFLHCHNCGNAEKSAKEATLDQARKMVSDALNEKTNLCVECGG